ncbi:MAG: phosphoribosylglycinamide formyltransferase [Alphaproteobacteria bacterium]|nr:phosphoribosylglycinamide formyltransferase [Rhizobiaceae bacterium]MBU3961656.1 phosphoribosylglycinamide formyltransferase [Alphaproteobacteria bacterium]MBU4050180.1 phosphoribosylglycinamide formyltransferase [Alphaproteobacteria bacterium]MBU4091430.1 phosphoribosylglycinamide formyltransferase [Alphaproteobacteria bacterium]MBU4158112.1 phosphoribosylglycinamide formyltransferase [Alphaproteobacteria bacterium]
MTTARKRVVVFISGGGSNMVALADACAAPDFPAEIVAVISDKPTAGGLAKAAQRGIATHVFERRAYASKAEHEAAILAALAALSPDIICLAGYMRLLSADFIRPYQGRILNIHPSLLPLFPGLHTHQRALDAGMMVAGCTVHFVTEGMDEGPIVAQSVVPVLPDDTSDSLAARVLTVEHRSYAQALRLFADGTLRMDADGRVVRTGYAGDASASLVSV